MRHPLTAAVFLFLLASCKHIPTDKERQGAMIHYDLGVQLQNNGDGQSAFKEFQVAVEMDPGFPEAHNALGLILQFRFARLDEAVEHFQTALQIRPDFSEVKVNLGNVYLTQKKYDEAIKLYEEALNDTSYATPEIAQCNLGWALYQKGDYAMGIDHTKAAVTINAKFCLGYKNLGMILESQGKNDEACKQYDKYKEHCADRA